MGSKKFWFVSAALFAITFAGLLLLNDWRRDPPPEAEHAAHALRVGDVVREGRYPSGHVAADPADDVSVSGAVPASVSDQGLHGRLQNATDYRVLFESLLSSPVDLSSLYARHILKVCANARRVDLDALSQPDSWHQIEARQRWRARCSSFIDSELTGQRRIELEHDPRTAGAVRDIFLSDVWSRSAFNSPEHDRIRDQVLAYGDPLLLESFGPSLFVDMSGERIEIQGEVYPQSWAGGVAMLAWMGAVCEATGVHCGSGDYFVMERCAIDGHCAASRQELMRDDAMNHAGEEAVKVYDAMRTQFVNLIRTRGRISSAP